MSSLALKPRPNPIRIGRHLNLKGETGAAITTELPFSFKCPIKRNSIRAGATLIFAIRDSDFKLCLAAEIWKRDSIHDSKRS